MPNRKLVLILAAAGLPIFAQLPAQTEASIDAAVKKTMAAAGVTSVSIAIVKDARIAYVKAYGDARLEPKIPATPEMRYKIASNSKQITATALLLLAEDGKLSIDDPVSRFLPDLTRANEVAIRELLSHTSGYQDYYPLDYVAPFMAQKVSPQHIVDTWAKKPLDFEPGTQWQYSNTNYTIAGLIIEKITGKPVFEFVRARILEPLGMHSAIDVDATPWSDRDATGYVRYALGPSRVAPGEAKGWMYAAGELGMTASDLARWDISLMNGTVLKPASLKELTTEVHLKNGAGTGYALGLGVSNRNGHRKWAHGGGADGFISENFTLPDDRISVTVLTNQEDPAAHQIASDIEGILIAPPADPDAPAALERVRGIFSGLQNGKLDRSLLSDDGNAYFTPAVVADFEKSLKPLGAPVEFKQSSMSLRGGMVFRSFSIKTATKALLLTTFALADGKLAQYMIYPAERK
jgi:CubicO group peptidase (beta-lactamase class C family)